jgi:glycosyltransferase involved in cell wall biosynthesis
MRILIVLTYYKPYKSGLTIYASRQAEALAAFGHDVTVLTSQYEPDLPVNEQDHGVKIIRLPVAFRFSKGVIMPQMPIKAWEWIGKSDIVNLHLPQADAALIAFFAKLKGKPVVSTYHCDLEMPKGWINKLAGWGANFANHISARLSDAVVHNTRDFAENSKFLRKYLNNLTVIQPPIQVENVNQQEVDQFVAKFQLDRSHPLIGMVSRLAAEKGVEYLVEALPEILKSFPDAKVVFVGNFENVIGEQQYKAKIMPMIQVLGERWQFLGILSESEKAAFFEICDVLVLPSINSTESFGMVQVEAMTCGTPVVATDLPGVRHPVRSTGMGKIVPIKDSHALAEGIINVLGSSHSYKTEDIENLQALYSPETIALAYESLYKKLMEANGTSTIG